MKQVEFIKASMLKLNESGGVILPPAPFKFVNGGGGTGRRRTRADPPRSLKDHVLTIRPLCSLPGRTPKHLTVLTTQAPRARGKYLQAKSGERVMSLSLRTKEGTSD